MSHHSPTYETRRTRFDSIKRSTVCAFALCIGLTGIAHAQADGNNADEGVLEEIHVTGSRIQRTGMTTPTPVTAMEVGELNNMAPGNLIESLNQLPQFFNNESPRTQFNSGGAAGASNLNVRGIGTNRTLVLLDGRRIVSSNRLGTTDINVFPEAMIERVDIVTGGASAAYGTDAVAGVANFILDTDFTGAEGHVQGGITSRGDAESYEASFSFGTDLSERTHLIMSADIYERASVDGYEGRDWYQGWGTVTNPDPDGPNQIIAPNVVSTQYTFGGLIRAPGTPLDRLMFTSDGTVTPFVQSDLSIFDGGTQSQSIAPEYGGGSGDNIEADRGGQGGLTPQIDRSSIFTRLDFDVTDDITVFAQGIFGHNKTNAVGFTSLMFGPWQATLFQDNAFLPQSVKDTMAEYELDSVGFSSLRSTADLGRARFEQENNTISGTVGFDADVQTDGFFDGWNVQGYYQYGKNKNRIRNFNFPRVDRIFLGLDSVRDPDTGAIVCRAALHNPEQYGSCKPLNLLGEGQASQEAIDWATEGTQIVRASVVQHFAEVSASGEVWDGLGAGPVSGAIGASYREDSITQIVDDPTNPTNDPDLNVTPMNDPANGIQGIPFAFAGQASGFQFLGSTSVEGSFNVKEVFAETLVPLVSDQAFAERLDLNLAARWADYSGSGGIWAYKAGLDWQVYSDLRLRGTYSRDVRAATLSERFDSQGQGASAEDPRILDEEGNPISYAFGQTIGGNPEVDPEKADTITIGTVYQPSYFDGFSVSVDWYQIKVKGAIDQLGVQRIVDDCFAGAEDLCDQITRADEPLPGEPVGRITNIDNVFLNVDQAKVSGIDIETTYNTQLELFGGGAETLGFRALTSWLDENSITNVGAQKDERAGEIPPFGPGFPEWKATGNITYSNGPFTLFVQERFIGSAKRDNEDVEGIDINDNTVSAAYYTDLRLSYNIDAGNGSIEVFGNVTNVFDENPPITASHFNFFGSTQVNESVHGVLGRRFTLGARFRY